MPRVYLTAPGADRFWSKVNKDGLVPEYAPHLGPCWTWSAGLMKGYGSYRTGSRALGTLRNSYAHRWSYELLVGPIPAGLQLDHLCRVKTCVRPSHLEPVTQRVNLLRGFTIVARCAGATHCPQGHEYTDANTKWEYPRERRGKRKCATCCRARCNARARVRREERRAALVA